MLPVCPSPFVSVVVQDRGISRAVIVPRFATLPQLCWAAQSREDGPDTQAVTTTPGVISSDRRRPLCLRNGDCVGLPGGAHSREGGLSACLQYRDPKEALSAAS